MGAFTKRFSRNWAALSDPGGNLGAVARRVISSAVAWRATGNPAVSPVAAGVIAVERTVGSSGPGDQARSGGIVLPNGKAVAFTLAMFAETGPAKIESRRGRAWQHEFNQRLLPEPKK